jgi:hypothetical protein
MNSVWKMGTHMNINPQNMEARGTGCLTVIEKILLVSKQLAVPSGGWEIIEQMGDRQLFEPSHT